MKENLIHKTKQHFLRTDTSKQSWCSAPALSCPAGRLLHIPFFRSTPLPSLLLEPLPPGSGPLFLSLLPPTHLSSQGSLQAFPWFYITKTSALAVRDWILIREKEEGGRKAVPASDKDKIFLSELGQGVIGNRRAGAPTWWGNPGLSHKLCDKLEKTISLFFFFFPQDEKSEV